MSEEEKKPVPPDMPRTFMSRAYLLPITGEKDLYGLYRNIEVMDPATGQREKAGAPIGPIRILRPMKPGEEDLVRVKTVHPKTGAALDLVEWNG
jgi:hypothetical protein